MSKIKEIIAREIKDSRSKPTVEVEITTDKGSFVASCPSGASTGKNEALELRDADGRGVTQAIKNVNEIIAPKLKGKDPVNQKALDELMIALDGAENKSQLGANAILPVSMAICRAGAGAKKLPLYTHISQLANFGAKPSLPQPMFNLLEGGAHAVGRNDLKAQEFMVVPRKKTFAENILLGSNIFDNLKKVLAHNFGEVEIAMGDEGGFAPDIDTTEQALFLLKNAIAKEDATIALDIAASQFFNGEKYLLDGQELSRAGLLDFYTELAARFAIISIEDPFAEEDWEGFKLIVRQMPNITIVGDDLTTTNIKKIKEAKSKNACNGVIIKPNQIGTVSETIEAANLAKSYGWKIMVSHRSGETMDTFIADLAVGVSADFIKSGSPSQPERMVKYNRLLEIETELNKKK